MKATRLALALALVASIAGAAPAAPPAAAPAAPSAAPAAPSAAPPAAPSATAPEAAPASAPSVDAPPPAPPPAAPTSASPPPALPDPEAWQQEPKPVQETPAPLGHVPKADVGVDAGVVSRPTKGGPVSYGASWAVGPHVRVKPLSFLAARVHARVEGNSVSFADGALGLPSGTHVDQPALRRVLLGFALEPTWTPIERLDLFVGVGVSWARSIGGTLHATGAETVVLPPRSAVFVEFPFSLGVRFEVIPRWLAVSATGAVAVLTNQSGSLLGTYDAPGKSGTLVTVGGFPEMAAVSVAGLAGIGILL